jgi:hypothetical protein
MEGEYALSSKEEDGEVKVAQFKQQCCFRIIKLVKAGKRKSNFFLPEKVS